MGEQSESGEEKKSKEGEDLFQSIRRLLDSNADSIPLETRFRDPIAEQRYVTAKALSTVIGDANFNAWMERSREDRKKITPEEFDEKMESWEKESGLDFLKEIDRIISFVKKIAAPRMPIPGADVAEDILRDLLSGNPENLRAAAPKDGEVR
ncbi:MAG: hypothetical protein LBS68_00815 [Puniceicoccales bacterium]|jgi:hypothetical protein|nr:hypothetical protein [Puniceicoccales bacterium]